MRKFMRLLAVAAMAALSVAGAASATSNVANGTTWSGTSTTSIALGGVITCTTSSIGGTVLNRSAGAGAELDFNSVQTWFAGCGTGNSATPGVGTWSFSPTTGFFTSTWFGWISNVDLNIRAFGGLAICEYRGTLTSSNYDNITSELTLGGSLSKISGSSPVCPASTSASGVYVVSPAIGMS